MKKTITRITVFIAITFIFPILHAYDDNNDSKSSLQNSDTTFNDIGEVFGFYNQKRYSYCPSVIKKDDGTIHMYFCGNPTEKIMVDNIYHIRIDPDGSQTPPKSVLQPTTGAWDSHHVCDPSVIAGSFNMEGKNYKYAMFFLGNRIGRYYNEIGVAFSNDLEADEWVKYPKQLIEKTWSGDNDQVISGKAKSWGVGQPSAVSMDHKGKVLLTYTAGDIAGTRILWSELDMSNMDSDTPVTVVAMRSNGLLKINDMDPDFGSNADFAINMQEDIITMVRPIHKTPDGYPKYVNEYLEVNYMSLSAFRNSTGHWSKIIRITPEVTGYPRNHNAAIERNMYGEIRNWIEPTIYYTVSNATPDVSAATDSHAEWTYHIWKGKVGIKKQKKR